MAQLSRLAQLYLKISDNLTEDDVRNLRSLLSLDEILGKAKVEKATPLEIFNMLVDNNIIGKGKLGLLVEILKCLGKGKLANEAERLEQEHKMEEKKTYDATAMTPEPSAPRTAERGGRAATATSPGSSVTEDRGVDDTDVKVTIPEREKPKASVVSDEAPGETDDQQMTSELASLHIKEMARLENEPMTTLGSEPSELDSCIDDQGVKTRMETLLAELDTPAVMADQEKQCDLYCQIGDLYRAKLYNLQSAQQYYESMLNCSKALSEDIEQAKAHNRLGLTYDMLGKHEEAIINHERVLDIYNVLAGNKVYICVAYKNLASSLTLSGKLANAKSNYKSALRLARKIGNRIEEIDIHCKLGDLHRKQLREPQISHKYYTNMLALAKDSGSKYWEMLSYNRLALVCDGMQDNEQALEWFQKALALSPESADKRDEIISHMNLGASLCKKEQAKSHLDTALKMAQQRGEQYGQMWVYMAMGDMQKDKFNSPRTSIQYYEQYLTLARQLGDRRQEGVAYNKLGWAHSDMREYEAALEWFQKQLKISQEIGDKKEDVPAHAALGNAYRSLGNIEQAKSHFDTALQMAQETGDLHGQMGVYFSMGDLHRDQLHSPRTSIQYYEQYLTLARQLGRSVEEALAYERLGLAHYEMGEYEKALECHQKHLDKSQDNGDNKHQIKAHANIGRTYRLLGSPVKGTSHISTALQLADKTGDLHGQMEVNLGIGDMQKDQLHSPRTAIQYYEQYLALARQLGNRHEEGVAYNRLGLANLNMRKYETALEWHQKNLKTSQESGDKKGQVTALRNVADTYRQMGKLDQAKSHFDTALQMAQQTEDRHGQMDVYSKMGDMQREQLHSPRTAIRYYEQHLALARQLGDRKEEGWAFNSLGLTHGDMGEHKIGLEWCLQYLKISPESGCKKEEITSHTAVAKSYWALGKGGEAKSYLDTALEIAQQTGDPYEQMEVYFSMGEMHREQLHSPRTAIQYYEQYLVLARQVGDMRKEGMAYNRLGLAHGAMGGHKKGLEWSQQYLKISQESGCKREEITANTVVGKTYGALGHVDQATSHFDTALDMARNTGDQCKQMEVYFSMGEMQREQLHSPRTAIQYYEQYLTLARQVGNRHEEAVAYNKLGHAHDEMKDYQQALEWHQKTLTACQEHGDKKQQRAAELCLGDINRKMGEVDQATCHYNTALHMVQQTGDLYGQMLVYQKLGDLQREQLHSPRTAIQYYEQHLALARQLGDRHQERVAYNRLGLAHYDMTEYETALEWHEKELTASQERGDKKEQITALRNVGNAYRLLGKLDQASSHFDAALQMAQQTGDLHGQMDVYFSMGEMQNDQIHSPRTSIQYYEQYLALARQLGERYKERAAYNKLGQARSDMKEYEKAFEWHQKYLKASQESGDRKEQITALENVGDTYRLLGKVDEAKLHFSRALQMAQQTGNQYGQMRIYIRMGDLQGEQLRSPRASIQYYEQAVALAGQLNDIHHLGVSYCGLGVAHYDMGEYKVALEWFQRVLKMRQESGKKKGQITAHKNMAASYHALGKSDEAKSHYQSAMTLAMETGDKQEQEVIAKKLTGRQSCNIS